MKLIEIKPLNEIELTPIDDKLFKLGSDFNCKFITDEGVYHLHLKKGWITDLRSGSDIINYLVPKWGNPLYTACVLGHDCSFSGWISFDLANDLFLKQGMAISEEISTTLASIACEMVGKFGRSHYYDFDTILPEPYTNNKELESLTLEAK